jgi:rubrerythrin
MYLFSPKFSHRFVGYLEEEAVHTYTKCIEALDNDKLPLWKNKKAPDFAIQYYGLSEEANMREVLLNIRADEAIHRSINHHFSDIP